MERATVQNNTPAPVSTSEHGRLFRAARATGVTALAIGALLTGAGKYYADDAMVGPRHLVDLATNHGADPVNPETTELIKIMARDPINPELKQLVDDDQTTYAENDLDGDGRVENYGTDDIPQGKQTLAETYRQYCIDAAYRNGLELSDPRPFMDRVDEAQSAEEVLAVLKNYGDTLGVDVVTHDKKDLKDIGTSIKPYDQEKLIYSNELKDGTDSLLAALSFIPKEVFEYLDIKEIRIVESLGEHDNPIVGKFIPEGEANPITGILYLPQGLLNEGGFSIILHEVAHRMDYRLNGNSAIGAIRDEQYVALNDEQFEYGSKTNEPGDVASRYGETDPMEDKASAMEAILGGIEHDYFIGELSPVLTRKYALLLGRLEEAVPGYVQYLMEISARKGF